MSQKTEKKERRERKKTIQKFIKDNEDMVLAEVITELRKGSFAVKVAFFIGLLKKGK